MMKHKKVRELLDDYVDGALQIGQQEFVEAHLRECAECRDELAAIRALLVEARELPRSIEPSRDLWSDIGARLDETDDTVAGGSEPGHADRLASLRARSVWSLRYQLAAAALALVVVSAAVTAILTRGSRDGPGSGSLADGPANVSLVAQWQAAESEYLRATAELAEELEVVKPTLDRQVVVLIEENLQIIDAAIQESRTALASDPGNSVLVDMLRARYEKKLEVLQQVNRISARL